MAVSNLGEFGQVLTANMGEDVSVNTGLEFILTPQLGPAVTRDQTAGVTVGLVNKTVGDTLLLANQYLEYTVMEDDFDRAGVWRKQGVASISATKKVVGNGEFFTVLPGSAIRRIF